MNSSDSAKMNENRTWNYEEDGQHLQLMELLFYIPKEKFPIIKKGEMYSQCKLRTTYTGNGKIENTKN